MCDVNVDICCLHDPHLLSPPLQYLGVYRSVPVSPDDEVIEELQVVSYTSLGEHNMKELAAFIAKRPRHFPFYITNHTHRTEAEERMEGEDSWEQLTPRQQDMHAMMVCLEWTGFDLRAVPVEFVRYDEELYQTLVESGAAVCRKGVKGTVSLDPDELGLYH